MNYEQVSLHCIISYHQVKIPFKYKISVYSPSSPTSINKKIPSRDINKHNEIVQFMYIFFHEKTKKTLEIQQGIQMINKETNNKEEGKVVNENCTIHL